LEAVSVTPKVCEHCPKSVFFVLWLRGEGNPKRKKEKKKEAKPKIPF